MPSKGTALVTGRCTAFTVGSCQPASIWYRWRRTGESAFCFSNVMQSHKRTSSILEAMERELVFTSPHVPFESDVRSRPAELVIAAAASQCASDSLEGLSSKETLRIRLYICLALIDIISISLGFVVANVIRFGEPMHRQGLEMLMIMVPIFMAFSLARRAYGIEALQFPRKAAKRGVESLLFGVAVVLSIAFALKASEDFSRVAFWTGTVVSLAVLPLARWTFCAAVGRRYQWRFTNDVLLVDGAQALPRGGELVVFADQAQLSARTDDPHLLDRLGRLLRNCDRVIVSCASEKRTAWAATLRGAGVDVEVLTPELDSLGALQIRRFGDRATLMVGCGPLGLRDRALKRVLDLSVAVAALLILAPVMLLVAIAIKAESRGPILFKQPRMGRGNRIFNVLKFRSMRTECLDQTGLRSTSVGDIRITKVGRFIRKTSIDELPQLFNVMRGEMSIVGPRPHALGSKAEDNLFWTVEPRYWDRHAMKPGITGLAQVRGFRGATMKESDLTSRVEADLEYLAGWSLGRDVLIILRTFRVLSHRNAF